MRGCNRHGRRYLYYVSSPLQAGCKSRCGTGSRIAAKVIENAVFGRLRGWSGKPLASISELTTILRKVTVHRGSLVVQVQLAPYEDWTNNVLAPDRIDPSADGLLQICSLLTLFNRGGRTWLDQAAGHRKAQPDRAFIAGLRHAHSELQRCGIDMTDQRGRVCEPKGIDDPYLRKLTSLGFLAPDLQRAILEGKQPAGLTLSALLATPLPLD